MAELTSRLIWSGHAAASSVIGAGNRWIGIKWLRLVCAAARRSTLTLGESAMHAEMWEPIEGICEPCDHISFSYIPLHAAEIRMTFAASAGGGPRELILRFKHVVVLSGEDEAPGGFVSAPCDKFASETGVRRSPDMDIPSFKNCGFRASEKLPIDAPSENRAFLHGIDGQSGACYCKHRGRRSLEHLNTPGCLRLTIGSSDRGVTSSLGHGGSR
jgi:hypothetical protein